MGYSRYRTCGARQGRNDCATNTNAHRLHVLFPCSSGPGPRHAAGGTGSERFEHAARVRMCVCVCAVAAGCYLSTKGLLTLPMAGLRLLLLPFPAFASRPQRTPHLCTAASQLQPPPPCAVIVCVLCGLCVCVCVCVCVRMLVRLRERKCDVHVACVRVPPHHPAASVSLTVHPGPTVLQN